MAEPTTSNGAMHRSSKAETMDNGPVTVLMYVHVNPQCLPVPVLNTVRARRKFTVTAGFNSHVCR